MFTRTVLLSLCFVASAQGAVLIESIDDDGKKGRVLIEAGRARIDAGTLGGYMLINLDDGSAYAIDHGERAVLNLRTPLVSTHPQDSKAKPHKSPLVSFKKLGKGPVIAGYQTIRYRFSIDGLHCFDEYLSEQLLTIPHVKRFVEIIGEATTTDAQTNMGAPFDSEAPCEAADVLVDDYYHKLGIPLRTVDSNGLISHEITHIDTAMDPPAGTFTSPPGYKEVTREELIERTASKIPGHGDLGELNSKEVEKLQEQIRKQLEAMKKRREGTATSEDMKNIDTAPVNK